MNLLEFNELCQSVWQEYHGEIINLWLTEDSYKELSRDSIIHRAQDQMMLRLRPDYAEDGVHGAVITTVINPITRSAVRMKLCKGPDAMDISDRTTGQLFTKFL